CAQMLSTGGSEADVITHVTKLQTAHPDDPRFQILMALAVGSNDRAAALEWCRKATTTGHLDDPEVLQAAVDLLDQLEQHAEALKSRPKNPYVHLALGDAYSRLGETDAALAEWSEAENSAPFWGRPQARIMQVQLGSPNVGDVKKSTYKLQKTGSIEPDVRAV